MSSLPILPVLLPLLAAPLAVLLHRPRLASNLGLIAAASSTACCWQLLQLVLISGPIRYELGGWPPPFGIEYVIDEVNALVMLVVASMATVCLAYARVSAEAEIDPRRQTVFHALFLLCLTGLLGIAATADAFNVFVFLEISSLATYALVAAGPQRRALLAAFQYLVLGTLGGSFLLIGVGFLYQATGTLNMADLAVRLPNADMPRVVLAGAAMVMLGLALKSALFPMHQWLPNVYAEAPAAVSAFLASAATKVAIYAIARLGIGVMGVVWFSAHGGDLLQLLAIFAMVYGAVLATRQQDVRRILAFSSISQIGYLVWGLGLATPGSIAASFIHIANHAVIKGALFLAVGGIIYRCGGAQLSDLHGLARRMPWTFALILIAGLGLMGVPLTAGFVSKLYLLRAAIDAQALFGLAAMIVSSVLGFVYVGRIFEAAYLKPAADDSRCEAPAGLLIPTAVLVAASIWLGVDSSGLVNVAQLAAARLLGTP